MQDEDKQNEEPTVSGDDADVEASEYAAATPPPQPPEDTQAPSRAQQIAGGTKRAATRLGQFCTVVAGAIGNVLKTLRVDPREPVVQIARLLDWARQTFPADQFNTLSDRLIRFGHVSLVAAQLLAALFGLTVAIRASNWIFFLYGLGVALLLAILQHTADRFLGATDAFVDASPSALRSPAVLDTVALVSEAVGILAFLRLLILARAVNQWSLAVVGLGVWALADSLAYIALHPRLTNVTFSSDVRASEEAVGILSFLVKAGVRTVPLAFGFGTIIGAVGFLWGTLSLIISGQALAGLVSLKLIAVCAGLPFLSYVLFVAYQLVIDLIRAILRIPGEPNAG